MSADFVPPPPGSGRLCGGLSETKPMNDIVQSEIDAVNKKKF